MSPPTKLLHYPLHQEPAISSSRVSFKEHRPGDLSSIDAALPSRHSEIHTLHSAPTTVERTGELKTLV